MEGHARRVNGDDDGVAFVTLGLVENVPDIGFGTAGRGIGGCHGGLSARGPRVGPAVTWWTTDRLLNHGHRCRSFPIVPARTDRNCTVHAVNRNRAIEAFRDSMAGHESFTTPQPLGLSMNIDERLLFAIVLAVGVVVPGAADYALASLGFETVGMVVWGLGYLGMALFVWYRWVRPLDFGMHRDGS
jgi:hypothetical protein